MITVVAALIERNGRLLVCQRRRDAVLALKWEFPGGKVHAGETPQSALARELREELAIDAAIGREIYRTRYQYSSHASELELLFFAATLPDDAHVQNLQFEAIQWELPQNLPGMDFLPADRQLINKIAGGELDVASQS